MEPSSSIQDHGFHVGKCDAMWWLNFSMYYTRKCFYLPLIDRLFGGRTVKWHLYRCSWECHVVLLLFMLHCLFLFMVVAKIVSIEFISTLNVILIVALKDCQNFRQNCPNNLSGFLNGITSWMCFIRSSSERLRSRLEPIYCKSCESSRFPNSLLKGSLSVSFNPSV